MKMNKDLINDYRAIVLPALQNILIKQNFEGRGLSDALELEKDFNEILRLAEKALDSQWIPVSEGLPEEKINPYTNAFDEVLCTTDWGEVIALKFGTPIIHHKPHFWLGGAIMDEHIIAWQYKPEPYKKEGEEA